MDAAMSDTAMVIEAKSHLHPEGFIVESASLLADAVLAGLRAEPHVKISFAGMHGTSSSYFNTLLRRLIEASGVEVLVHVEFSFVSQAQQQIYERSRAAVTKLVW
jgi:hypothetical protein